MNKLNLRMIEPEIDTENMEISFSAASPEPYDRGWCIEILNCTPDSINLDRLNNGASILKNHNDNHILGKVIKAWAENDRLYVRAQFCKNNEDAVSVFKDICDGTLQNVSVGYIQDEFIDRQLANGRIERTVTRWTCLEVSVAVGVPADPTVGFFRSFESETETKDKGAPKMAEENKNEAAEQDAIAELKSELAELKSEIENLKNEPAETVETETEETETEPAEKQEKSMTKEIRSLNVRTADSVGGQSYSLARAFQAALGQSGCEMERQLSDELYRNAGLSVKGGNAIMLSTREFTAANGGGLIGTDHKASMFVEGLKTRMALKNATVLSGLVGNVSIPAQTGEAAVTQGAVNGAIAGSDPAVGSIELTPKKFGGLVTIGKDLLVQGNPSAVAFVINDLGKQIARKIEAYAYDVIGSNESVQEATFADITKPTWAETTDIVGMVEDYEVGDLTWIMKGGTKANFKQASKDAGSGRFICEDGEIDGFGVDVSGQCPADTVFFGAFENIVIGEWGGLEIIIDQYTLADKGAVRVIGTLLSDVAVRNPEGFVVATA